MRTFSSAIFTWREAASASEYTATLLMPIRRAVLITRQAISPRLAIRIFLNILPLSSAFLIASWEVRVNSCYIGNIGLGVIGPGHDNKANPYHRRRARRQRSSLAGWGGRRAGGPARNAPG